jgi:hypothetical protein
MSDDEARFDALLSQPLEEPADAAFSTRVLAHIGRVNARREVLETCAAIAAAGCLVALLPLTGAGRAIAQSASQLAYSMPLVLGAVSLLLSWVVLQTIQER